MFAIILYYSILLLAIIGLTICIEWLWLSFLHPKNSPKRSILIYLNKNIAKMQIREILEELKWRGDKNIKSVFLVNNNIDQEDFIAIKKEFEKNKLIFIDKPEIKEWIP